MVYKLNIFIVPDNTDITKIKEKGELFKPSMLEGAKDPSNNKDVSNNNTPKKKKKKDPTEIKEPIALNLTYTEKMKGSGCNSCNYFLRDNICLICNIKHGNFFIKHRNIR